MTALSLETATVEIAARVRESKDTQKEPNPRRRNHGNTNDACPPAVPAVHARQCDAKGAPRRRCLEYSRSCKSSSGIHDRFTMEESIGIHHRTKRSYLFPLSQVGQGTGLQAYQRNVGV